MKDDFSITYVIIIPCLLLLTAITFALVGSDAGMPLPVASIWGAFLSIFVVLMPIWIFWGIRRALWSRHGYPFERGDLVEIIGGVYRGYQGEIEYPDQGELEYMVFIPKAGKNPELIFAGHLKLLTRKLTKVTPS